MRFTERTQKDNLHEKPIALGVGFETRFDFNTKTYLTYQSTPDDIQCKPSRKKLKTWRSIKCMLSGNSVNITFAIAQKRFRVKFKLITEENVFRLSSFYVIENKIAAVGIFLNVRFIL